MSVGTSRFEVTGFHGDLLHPGDAGYDEARQVFNGLIDRRPALIARCYHANDVAAVIGLARERGLELTVYGGGHGVTGAAVCDGAVCLDLRGMKAIDIDADAATVRAEAGLTWGELDAATQGHGLAVTGGRISTTGIGGLALGSGSGWLERKFGFTCDNLIQAEVVTADGRQLLASETENAELFWALRGGGGNFGVVTAFHLRLHPVGPIVLGGMLIYPASIGRELVRCWRDFMLGAPDEVGSGLAFICAPPEEFVPEPVRGRPVIGVVVCYAGDPDEGASVLGPLTQFGPPAVNLVQPMPYVAVQQLLDPTYPKGLLNYWTGDFFGDLPGEAIDTLVGRATQPVSPLTQIIIIAGGGAISRVDDHAMAFGQRQTPWNIHYMSIWDDPKQNDENITYTKELSGAMKPWATGRVYLNFLGDEGEERVASGFGPEKYARLRRLKAQWDPTNLFRHNQNIPPSSD
ncbi:MAG: FAD-binding oxidoreductase [Acidimicrobiaceae bacterium]|nr:FAD-binding oxidoreductase [Acidimicrobiaceae bacterium]